MLFNIIESQQLVLVGQPHLLGNMISGNELHFDKLVNQIHFWYVLIDMVNKVSNGNVTGGIRCKTQERVFRYVDQVPPLIDNRCEKQLI